MKKRLLWIAVIIFAIVIIPIVVFQTIKLATRPASISLEEARNLPLEEGQEMYTAVYDRYYYGWAACFDGKKATEYVYDDDERYPCEIFEIRNDSKIRHFQNLEINYVVIVRDTGEETKQGFRIVVVDDWYVLEEEDE